MIPMMNYYSRVSKDIGARIRENVLEREDFFQIPKLKSLILENKENLLCVVFTKNSENLIFLIEIEKAE